MGHFTQGIKETPLKLKKIFGSNGYMVGVLKAVFERKNKETSVIGDNRSIYQGKTFTIHLGNLKTTRGGVKVTPLAKPNDGKIDMLLARGIGKIEALKTLPKVLEGKHLTHPAVIYGQFKRIKIESEGDHLAIDGEYLGIARRAEVVYHGEIAVITNRNLP
ncbi:MAG: diacylglycerol/lipid kinase family protein [Candidatus Njordarchaeia archaeon]